MEHQQSIIERSVALIGYDKVVAGDDYQVMKNVVVAAGSTIGKPMVEKYVPQFIDPNQRLILSGAVTSLALYAYDYVQGGARSNWMEYLKKGFGSELAVHLYKNMKK